MSGLGVPAGPKGESFVLWRPEDGEEGAGVLFTGDRLLARIATRDPLLASLANGPQPLFWPRAAWFTDAAPDEMAARMEGFRLALRRLLDEHFSMICPGHGGLVLRDAKRELTRLLEAGTVHRGREWVFLALPR